MRDRRTLEKLSRHPNSVFGKAANFSGNVAADDPILIDGAIDGEVRGTFVTVGREASVKGAIYAETVAVSGSVDGLIKAVTVTVSRFARLKGEVICEQLGVEEGAEVSALCKAWP